MNETPVVEAEDGYYVLPPIRIDLPTEVELQPRDGLDYMIWGMLVHTPPRWNSVVTTI